MVPSHIKSPDDLITSDKQIEAGFISQAVTKAEKAQPYIDLARQLYQALTSVKSIHDLAAATELHPHLFAAAGISDKSSKHLDDDAKWKLLEAVLTKLAETSPQQWREELVYRFLLTRGDSLGGSMRNWIGAEASMKLADAVQQALKRKGITPAVHASDTGKITSLTWKNRVLLIDRPARLPGLTNNIDMHLLDTHGTQEKPNELMKDPNRYLACGELKGGIDPAGADEHWKTGNTAIDRIRTTFTTASVKIRLFLVAAAIEKAMASEIYNLLKSGKLDYAANLTVAEQMVKFSDWLVSLKK